ncbi:MAG TPA: ion channel [Acetobacteraceae bacterium]|nr:ion channel [Acetobacteraceae bacterium]
MKSVVTGNDRLRRARALAWRWLHSIAQRRRNGRLSRLVLGGYTITMKGLTGFDLRDSYHSVIALSWPRFILLAVAVHITINIGFALLYLAQPGAIANVHPGSLADAFFFSVETSATVGYGEMYPATLYGHIVCTVEIFVGVSFTALATGLLFVRFSRPRARILYAAHAVVASHAGRPTLMIRIANGRRSLLYDAAAHLSLLLSIRGEGGEVVRQVFELQLARSRLPIFSLAWTLMHSIDETSPLRDYDAAKLHAHDALLLLGVEARDMTVSAGVIDTKGYAPPEILFGMRYAELVSLDEKGHPVADLTAVSRLEQDIGPEPPQTGWQDRNWTEA